jgi:SAM-dependent methyltransferase
VRDADALALLRAAVPSADGETWADLGAGTGVFTRALATIVGPSGKVFAVDMDDRALGAVREWAARAGSVASVSTMRGDVTRALDLPPLDGVVMANVLHFVREAEDALALVVSRLRPGGRAVLIEYEGRRASPWVPYPLPIARFRELAAGAGLGAPAVVATRPSAYGGELYVAVADRAA